MADHHIAATSGFQHRSGNLSRVCAFLLPVKVLPANAHVRSGGGGDGGRKIHEWRVDDDLSSAGRGHQRHELLKECGGFGGRLVHLPIAGHKRCSHEIASRKLSPWGMLVSKLWATVCPISASVARVPRSMPPRPPRWYERRGVYSRL